ncbi:hypothetical protein [Streptomyces mirabilis]|uniref:hypothetical protein n=1 Tax=Streptomyces mirabilis TaxID=68239 RepID=UPI0033D6D3B7
MSSAPQAPDPYAILTGWLSGAYVRPDGQQVIGRVWDEDTKYRYGHIQDWATRLTAFHGTPLAPIPRPLVWALDEYLPVRTHKAPHSTETEGPLLLSRTGRGLDHVTFTRLLREVAATHPDLEEIAPGLHPDVVAHSPSPFADESATAGGDAR